ncbi:MAG TPA: hypothetical protein VLM89_12915 [Phycisphaerae bacterium]|nr:hypothetical protein [Phycisphaerae bacterium]
MLAVLGTAELVLRAFEAKLSIDLLHIHDIPKISAGLAQKPRPRILFLGNSLTREGIDEAALKEGLSGFGGGEAVSLAKVFPDNTQIAEWYYAFRRYFINSGHPPDCLIISCQPVQLRDQAPFSIYGLGRHWIDYQDVGEVFDADLTVFGDKVEFVLSRASVMFANRFRISSRILVACVPGHEQLARRVNTMRNETLEATLARQEEAKPTYQRLKRFAELARANHVRFIVAAMPVCSPYDIDPNLLETARTLGVTVLDCRNVPGLRKEDYRDGYHLTPKGAAMYSAVLAEKLAPLLETIRAPAPATASEPS